MKFIVEIEDRIVCGRFDTSVPTIKEMVHNAKHKKYVYFIIKKNTFNKLPILHNFYTDTHDEFYVCMSIQKNTVEW